MADSSGTESDVEDTLESRHKKEQKELSAKIQALKKTVTKGDLKKKKLVTAEIDKLQLDLDTRQAKEKQEQSKKASEEKSTVTYYLSIA